MSKKTKQQRARKAHRLQRQLNVLQSRLHAAQAASQSQFRKELLDARNKLQEANDKVAEQQHLLERVKANNLDKTTDPVVTIRRASHPGYARGGQTIGFQVYLNTGELRYMVHEELRKDPIVWASRIFGQLEYDVVRQLRDIFTMAVEDVTGMGQGYRALNRAEKTATSR